MLFGRQIKYIRKFEEFKATAKTVHISQKRCTNAAAMKEFKELYDPVQYYAEYHDEPGYRDDTFQVWYKTMSYNTAIDAHNNSQGKKQSRIIKLALKYSSLAMVHGLNAEKLFGTAVSESLYAEDLQGLTPEKLNDMGT